MQQDLYDHQSELRTQISAIEDQVQGGAKTE